MKRALRNVASHTWRAILGWLQRPLIDAAPWTRRLMHYAVFLLLVAASSPLAHAYLGVRLSAGQMLVHTLIVVAAVGLAILAVEALMAGAHRIAGRASAAVATWGFLLRAAAAYLLSVPLVTLMHAPWAYTRAIMRAHAAATAGNTTVYLLPVVLLVVYVAYQLVRKDQLARQLAAERRINRELAAAQPGAERPAGSILEVPSRGVTVPLDVQSVMHVEADQNYCHVVADSGGAEAGSQRYLVRMTLSDAAARMPAGVFVQTHRSHLVNLQYVRALGRSGRRRELCLTNGDRVPVSRSREKPVQSRIAAFLAAADSGRQR